MQNERAKHLKAFTLNWSREKKKRVSLAKMRSSVQELDTQSTRTSSENNRKSQCSDSNMNNELKQRKSRPTKSIANMWRSLVLTSQEEFRRQGWNLAGANLLSLAVGLANRHYLYVRPRLTPRDFGIALIPMVIGALLATLIAYCASGNTVLPQMAALGCVLGLMGKINLK